MNTTQELVDLESFPSLGEALAEVGYEIVYREAQRQFAFLVAERQRECKAPNKTHEATNQDVDLPAHYQSLFHEATDGLDDEEEHQLLTICFAYKTKARVLEYLSCLPKEKVAWAKLFTDLIQHHGIDSAFLESQDPMEATSSEVNQVPSTSSLPRRYFVIPTLAIAFPGEFFMSLATLAPLHRLQDVSSVYVYPASPLLAVNWAVEGRISNELGKFLRRNLPAGAGMDHADVRPWVEFFNHLNEYDALLWPVASRTFGARLVDSAFMQAAHDGGYDEVDLQMWLAGWRSARQKGEERKLGPKGPSDKHPNGNVVAKDIKTKKNKVKILRARRRGEKRVQIKVDWGRGRPRKKQSYKEDYAWDGPSSSACPGLPSASDLSDGESKRSNHEA